MVTCMHRAMAWVTRIALGMVFLVPNLGFQATAQSRLRLEVQDDALRFSWSSLGEGFHYTIEATETWSPAAWRPYRSPEDWPIVATEWTGRAAPSSDAIFFRLVARPGEARGTIESAVLVRSFTLAELTGYLQAAGLPLAVQHGVEAWKVVYATPDPHQRPTRASALVVWPTGATTPRPLASYQHGTVLRRDDVPSRLNEEGNVGLILAGTGYLAVLPDYLGLGDSPGFHPYHHARSEATAVVDALRAARALIAEHGLTWNRQLFLIGYSQGGHATAAAQREIQRHHADEFVVTASAPGAGAYDMSGVTAGSFLSDDPQPSPYYFPYLLAAYVEVYDIAPSLADLLREPYDRLVPPLLDGGHDGGALDAILPDRPVDILRPEVLDAFLRDPAHPLRAALRENDLHTGWVPEAPTRLYHCRGDRDVPFANSQVALDTFTAAGARSVTLIDPLPAADHGGCAFLALLGGKLWFDTLRQ